LVQELKSKIEGASFRVERLTSFVTFPAAAIALFDSRQRDSQSYDPQTEYRAPRAVDRVMETTLEAERWLIGRGASLPAGGPLVAIASRTA
jgi:hypothetical protein